MATYQKAQVSAFAYTFGDYSVGGDERLFETLKAHKTAEVKRGEETVLVPFHAVKWIGKRTSSTEAEKADPYCK